MADFGDIGNCGDCGDCGSCDFSCKYTKTWQKRQEADREVQYAQYPSFFHPMQWRNGSQTRLLIRSETLHGDLGSTVDLTLNLSCVNQ